MKQLMDKADDIALHKCLLYVFDVLIIDKMIPCLGFDRKHRAVTDGRLESKDSAASVLQPSKRLVEIIFAHNFIEFLR